jgi:hypothetical protein
VAEVELSAGERQDVERMIESLTLVEKLLTQVRPGTDAATLRGRYDQTLRELMDALQSELAAIDSGTTEARERRLLLKGAANTFLLAAQGSLGDEEKKTAVAAAIADAERVLSRHRRGRPPGLHPTSQQPIHAKLWKQIESEGITIRHNARSTQPDPNEQGFFHPDLYGYGPTIQLWRNRSDTPDDYAQELVTLVHEYGHAISHRRGERPRREMPTASATLTEEEKDMIEAEEARAWKYAREVLTGLGFNDFALFDSRKLDADSTYAQRLAR